MALAEFLASLDFLAEAAQTDFNAAADGATLETARVAYLGAKAGKLRDAQKGLGAIPPADKPAAGKKFNEVKTAIAAACTAAQERLTTGKTVTAKACEVTLPGLMRRLGG